MSYYLHVYILLILQYNIAETYAHVHDKHILLIYPYSSPVAVSNSGFSLKRGSVQKFSTH